MQGKCVHVSGRYFDQCQIFSDDAVDLAGRWMDAGVSDIYIIDVEGSLTGENVHRDLIVSIAQRFPNLALHVEGGIRCEFDAVDYLDSGIRSVTLGSLALDDPALVAELSKRFPDRVRASLSLHEGLVHTHGGKKASTIAANVWARQLSTAGVSSLVYRDVQRIGTCHGANIEEAVKLAGASGVPLWVSGGVADMDDIRALYSESDVGLEAVLVSRALDEKSLSLKEAQDYCED